LTLKGAVFLDRDGVVNRAFLRDGIPVPPSSIAQLFICPGVSEAIKLLHENNLIPVVISNQPDVARGSTTKEKVHQINDEISKLTGIQHFFTCFHDDADECLCRKPKVGLILEALQDLPISLEKSALVGDRWRDIQLGQALGLNCYFVDYNYSETRPKQPFFNVKSLLEAVDMITKGSK
jgi:D-glycero-D-manno-heptose 1,7-bisphosphate phosphatase